MTKTDFQRKRFCGLFYLLAILTSVLINSEAHGAKITNDEIHGFYNPSLVQYVISKGSFPTVIIANPFGPSKDLGLLKFIKLPGYYPTTALSKITTKERDDGHLIIIFDPVISLSGSDACLSPTTKITDSGSNSLKNLHVLIVFCYDKEVVTEAYVEMKRPRNFTDQDFKKSMARLFSVLLPTQKPFFGGCADVDRGNC